MCWHTGGGYLNSGYRCGYAMGIGYGYERLIYHSDLSGIIVTPTATPSASASYTLPSSISSTATASFSATSSATGSGSITPSYTSTLSHGASPSHTATPSTSPNPLYSPSGPQTNVALSSVIGVNGWSVCFTGPYSDSTTPIASVQAACQGGYVMMACRQTGSSTLSLLGYATRADVFYPTGTGNTPHTANGIAWYYDPSYSWGFALAGDAVVRNSCDVGSTNAQDRLCWHTGYNNLNGGYRCGATTALNGASNWERVVLTSNLAISIITPSGTASIMATPSITPSAASTPSTTRTPGFTPTNTPSSSLTRSQSLTSSASTSTTNSPSASLSVFATPSATPSASASNFPLYTPFGPQTNVSSSALVGWSQCYSLSYGGSAPISTIMASCSGNNLMLGCRVIGADTLNVLGWSPRTDVTFATGTGNTPHISNGIGWYFDAAWSWGFAMQGDTINRNSCDIELAHPESRICLHTSTGSVVGGWRCGASTGLSGTYERVWYQSSLNGIVPSIGGTPTGTPSLSGTPVSTPSNSPTRSVSPPGTPSPTASHTIPSITATTTPSPTVSPSAPAPWLVSDLYPFAQDDAAPLGSVSGNAVHYTLPAVMTLLGTTDTGMYFDADGAVGLTAPPPPSGVAFPGPLGGPPFIAALWAPNNASAIPPPSPLDPPAGPNRMYFRASPCNTAAAALALLQQPIVQTLTRDSIACARATDDVLAFFPSDTTFAPSAVVVATWWRSVLAGATGGAVTAQLVIPYDTFGRTYAFVRYGGDSGSTAPPGVPFVLGLDSGEGIDLALAIAGIDDDVSVSASLLGNNGPSNTGLPGLFAFRAAAPLASTADCKSAWSSLNPRFGPLTGGTVVQLSGRCFKPTESLLCRFGDDEGSSSDGAVPVIVPAFRVSDFAAVCTAPFSTAGGAVPVYLAAWSDGSPPAAFAFVGYFTYTRPEAPELTRPAVRVVSRTGGTPR